MATLTGSGDTYGRVWEHNFRYYVRPSDQKVIVLQWDLDSAFGLGASDSILPTRNNIRKLFRIPQYRRLFDGHVEDIVNSSFNTAYSTTWANHLGSVSGNSFSSYNSYVRTRGNFALGTLPSNTAFAITTNGGIDFSEADSAIDLEGDGWIDVFTIEVNGIPTTVNWTDANSWMITIPIGTGANPLTLTAFNYHGEEVGSDTISVTNTSAVDLANISNTIISELHYHPAAPSQVEIDAGFNDADLFEFVELTNIGATNIDLTNAAFTDGVTFTFPPGTEFESGNQLIVVSNQAAFEFRYGEGTATIVGTYTGNFRNSGENVRLEAADTSPIADFIYGDSSPWPGDADGTGYSLVFAGNDPSAPLNWRSSTVINGNPGSSDSTRFSGGDLIAYSLVTNPTFETVGDSFVLNVRVNLTADDAMVSAMFSVDLATWTAAAATDLISRTNHGDGTATLRFLAPLPTSTTVWQFGRVNLMPR